MAASFCVCNHFGALGVDCNEIRNLTPARNRRPRSPDDSLTAEEEEPITIFTTPTNRHAP